MIENPPATQWPWQIHGSVIAIIVLVLLGLLVKSCAADDDRSRERWHDSCVEQGGKVIDIDSDGKRPACVIDRIVVSYEPPGWW